MTPKRLFAILRDTLRQLDRHGYCLTESEVRDVAGNQAQALVELCDEPDDPIARLLSARLAIVQTGIDASTAWFYGDKTPQAEAAIRAWAAEHADAVTVEKCCDGFSVDCRETFEAIVTWYPRYERAKADQPAEAPRVETSGEEWVAR